MGGFSWNCLLLQKVLRRDENCSFTCSRFFCGHYSFLCIILSCIENNHISTLPLEKGFHFAQVNNNGTDGSGTICSISCIFPAANTHPVG